ncbi:Tfp pilus assembly protein FimT/FimU [Vogesella sp. LIG4]|uniref:pilus assembly FimT family protein n=1 Tax=Vogesella sp. LIG4 TaxID=1192162 RepID=UPI0008200354|nr:GspH/FimT family pseudopilin [Vogesella sp. LIG4]SCK18857.1 prepilin-type N-terminal cleavage/methylation domain-containing protein [Vogesella sp. LIG4]
MTRVKGFTLFEAMVVMLIIAIFAAFTLPNFATSIKRSKVRKNADLVAQTMRYAKESALNSNTTIYVSVQGQNLCMSKVSATGCELRSDPLTTDVSASMKDTSGATPSSITSFNINGVYGSPSPKDVTFTLNNGSVSQSINMNLIGIVTIGQIS